MFALVFVGVGGRYRALASVLAEEAVVDEALGELAAVVLLQDQVVPGRGEVVGVGLVHSNTRSF